MSPEVPHTQKSDGSTTGDNSSLVTGSLGEYEIAGQFMLRPGKGTPAQEPLLRPANLPSQDAPATALKHARHPDVKAMQADPSLRFVDSVIALCAKDARCKAHNLLNNKDGFAKNEVAIWVTRNLHIRGAAVNAGNVLEELDRIADLQVAAAKIPLLDKCKVLLLCNSQTFSSLKGSNGLKKGEMFTDEVVRDLIQRRGEDRMFGAQEVRDMLVEGSGDPKAFTFIRADGTFQDAMKAKRDAVKWIEETQGPVRIFVAGHGKDGTKYIQGGYPGADPKSVVAFSPKELREALINRYMNKKSTELADYDMFVDETCDSTNLILDLYPHLAQCGKHVSMVYIASAEYGQITVFRTKSGTSAFMELFNPRTNGTLPQQPRTLADLIQDLSTNPQRVESNPTIFMFPPPAKNGGGAREKRFLQQISQGGDSQESDGLFDLSDVRPVKV